MVVLKFIVKHANILLNSWQYVFFFEIYKQKEETYRYIGKIEQIAFNLQSYFT